MIEITRTSTALALTFAAGAASLSASEAPVHHGGQADGLPLCVHVRTVLPDDDWRHIAARYGLVVTLFSPMDENPDLIKENERVRWVKSLNPDLKVLVYGSVINAANVRLPPADKSAGWFLKNEHGGPVVQHFFGGHHLDPGNEEWREFMGRAYADAIARYGYDGVWVDLVDSTTQYVNFKQPSPAVNPKTGMAYTDAEWKAATMGFLRVVRRHIGDRWMVINGAHGRKYFSTGYADYLEVADGMQNEAFTGWKQNPMQRFRMSEEEWKADVDALADVARRGKIMVAVANLKGREDSEPWDAYETRYRFVAASFLLGMGERHFLRFYGQDPGTPGIYRPGREIRPLFCEAALGRPLGAYQMSDGLYRRDFENGLVLANPTGREMQVPLTGQWKTAEGQPVDSPLTLPGHTGAILVRGS